MLLYHTPQGNHYTRDVLRYLKPTTKHIQKLEDRLTTALLSVTETMYETHTQPGKGPYIGMPFSGPKVAISFLPTTSRGQVLSIHPMDTPLIYVLSQVFCCKVMWEDVLYLDKPHKSIKLIGYKDRTVTLGKVLSHTFIELHKYVLSKRSEYSLHKENYHGTWPTAKGYVHDSRKEFICKLSQRIREKLTEVGDIRERVVPMEHLIDQWIMGSIKLDYRNYHYQKPPSYINAISKTYHHKRLLR